MHLFDSLQHRPFAALWLGQTASRLGDAIYRVALIWWVLQKTGSATVMGKLLACGFAPMVLFLLLGGVLADRIQKGRIMIVSDLGRGFVVAAVSALAASNHLTVSMIFVATFIFGLFDAFFQPAYAAILPTLTPAHYLNSANSLTSLSGQVSGVVGPALGGILLMVGHPSLAFGLNAASFFLAAICAVPLLRRRFAESGQSAKTGILSELREGIGAVCRIPWIWISIVLFGVANITLAGPFSVALPFVIKTQFKAGPGWLGVVYSFGFAGAIAGTLLIGMLKKPRWRGPLSYAATIIAGLMILLIGLPIPLFLVIAAVATYSAALSVAGLIWINMLQELVPSSLLGRVSSVDQFGSFILLPIGFALTGWLTDQLSAPTVFILGGVVTVMLLTIGFFHPAIRSVD